LHQWRNTSGGKFKNGLKAVYNGAPRTFNPGAAPGVLMTALLTVEGLTRRFGAITVADRVGFSLNSGTCLGVIGPNGAGKTSLFNLLTGALAPDSGRILFQGRDITALPLHARARLGIARTFQIPQPFDELTVYENALVAAQYAGGHKGAAAERSVRQALERTGLDRKAYTPAGGLQLLDRKRLELARALAATPGLLLLDEIAGGLTDPEVQQLIALIKELKTTLAIIWIEHIPHALAACSDRVMVLHFGKKLMEGTPAGTMASPEVIEIYMGIAAGAIA
jgi:branched-chain amino acid transport system ATP-binding protein